MYAILFLNDANGVRNLSDVPIVCNKSFRRNRSDPVVPKKEATPISADRGIGMKVHS